MKNTYLKYAFSGSRNIDNGGKEVGSTKAYLNQHFPELDWDLDQIINPDSGLTMLTFGQFVPNMSSMLFRSSAITTSHIKKIHRFKLTGDWFFVTLLQHGGGGFYVSDELNSFRKHETTASSKTKAVSRVAEYLYCRYFAWEKLRNRAPLSDVVRDVFVMARYENVTYPSIGKELLKKSIFHTFTISARLIGELARRLIGRLIKKIQEKLIS